MMEMGLRKEQPARSRSRSEMVFSRQDVSKDKISPATEYHFQLRCESHVNLTWILDLVFARYWAM